MLVGAQYRKHLDFFVMENWKEVLGYEGLYLVSSYGRIKTIEKKVKHYKGGFSLLKEKILKSRLNRYGYERITLWKEGKMTTMSIHRLVLTSFIPNLINKPQINHINGIKTNNELKNLEWCTNKENINHADSSLLRDIKGEKYKRSKITNLDVLWIRESNLSNLEIREKYNISRSQVSKIKNNTAWSHI